MDELPEGDNDDKFTDGDLAKCIERDQNVTGYFTGDPISFNPDGTNLFVDGEDTKLEIHFNVPRRYKERYQDASFLVSFHSRLPNADKDRSLCFTNREKNDQREECPEPSDLWKWGPDPEGNPCFSDLYAFLPWNKVMNTSFEWE